MLFTEFWRFAALTALEQAFGTASGLALLRRNKFTPLGYGIRDSAIENINSGKAPDPGDKGLTSSNINICQLRQILFSSSAASLCRGEILSSRNVVNNKIYFERRTCLN